VLNLGVEQTCTDKSGLVEVLELGRIAARRRRLLPSFPQSHFVDTALNLWHIDIGQVIPPAFSRFFDNLSVF